MLRKLIKIIIILFGLLMLVLIAWYGRYRFLKIPPREHITLMLPQDLEGYTDKLFYTIGDTIKLFVRAKNNDNVASVKRMTAYNESIELKTISFNAIKQELNTQQSEFGCS
jgi:hypothetical protein